MLRTRSKDTKRARTFARFVGDVLVEIITEREKIENEWHPDFLKELVDVTDRDPAPEVGWIKDEDGAISAPKPVRVPRLQEMQSAIEEGLEVTSAQPNISGTYGGSEAAIDDMLRTCQVINTFSAFPGGLASLDWIAKSGKVTFSNTADFIAVTRAVSDWRFAWQRFVDGLADLPPENRASVG